jgi:hypothetical protein
MDELMSVQKDAAAAVTAMLSTNVGCALCLIPCASAENIIGCAMACVKQVLPPAPGAIRAHDNAPLAFICPALVVTDRLLWKLSTPLTSA